MKYRKKPVVIEAFQYDGDLMNSRGEFYVPQWAIEAHLNGTLFFCSKRDSLPPFSLFVKTREGDMEVSVHDYVIKGVMGKIYPCKPNIFEMTYELVKKEKGENE